MIAWPLYAEQRMNATVLVEDVGVAVKPVVEDVGKGIIMREEIERVVRMVIEGEEWMTLRRLAEQLKESASKALSNDDRSSYELCCVDMRG
ncbi:hypothetical protein L484_021205 [Morus notabilis]|uniref:Uncharacterized protein n=1 Tax=Morus notabilis TaxID=981085 RepID=W9S112_9ROSA|nr:hypothetical protein L484_021205 [Morus notabilis]